MTTTVADLLAEIIAHPADDAPRLIYADWLEEHGDSARAEFIRVQCELARLPTTMDCTGISASWCPECGDCCCDREESMDDPRCPLHNAHSLHASLKERRNALWSREGELLRTWPAHPLWLGKPDPFPRHPHRDMDVAATAIRCFGAGVCGIECLFRRGFVAAITTSPDELLAHGDAITTIQPVDEVRLTDWPAIQFDNFFAADPSNWPTDANCRFRLADGRNHDDGDDWHYGLRRRPRPRGARLREGYRPTPAPAMAACAGVEVSSDQHDVRRERHCHSRRRDNSDTDLAGRTPCVRRG